MGSVVGLYWEIIDNMDLALTVYRAVDDGRDFVFMYVNSSVDGISHRTGLGPNISKGIVELHGGEIRAESDGPGKG